MYYYKTTINPLNRNCSKANTTLFIFLSKHMNSIKLKSFYLNYPSLTMALLREGLFRSKTTLGTDTESVVSIEFSPLSSIDQ